MSAPKNLCVLGLLAATACSAQNADGRLSLKIFGTAGCMDTVRFIQSHLVPVWQEFGDEFDFKYIPWGRTTREEDGSLNCQFQEADCWANRVQRCALDFLQSQEAQLSYLSCEYRSFEDRPAFSLGSYGCAQEAGINLIMLDYCVAWTGDALDSADEAATRAPIQAINFVPALVLNDDIDVDVHREAFLGLRDVICNRLLQNPDSTVTSC